MQKSRKKRDKPSKTKFQYIPFQVRHAAIQCICRVLERQPSNDSLTIDRNRQLVVDLRTLVPEPVDAELWVEAIVEAHVCLAGNERRRTADQKVQDDGSASAVLLAETVELFVKVFDSRKKLGIDFLRTVVLEYPFLQAKRC